MRLIDADRFDEDGGRYLRARLEFPDGKKTNGYFAVLTSVQIKDAPTVDAVPVVHAHRVHCHSAGGGTHWLACSECMNPIDYADNYCKNCGAKMDEEASE